MNIYKFTYVPYSGDAETKTARVAGVVYGDAIETFERNIGSEGLDPDNCNVIKIEKVMEEVWI